MYERIPVYVSPKSRLIRRELRLTLPVPAIHETIGTIRIADNTASWRARPEAYVEGDLSFDPLGVIRSGDGNLARRWRTSEIINGRLAMLCITGFAVQEATWGKPVVEQTPLFFGPLAW